MQKYTFTPTGTAEIEETCSAIGEDPRPPESLCHQSDHPWLVEEEVAASAKKFLESQAHINPGPAIALPGTYPREMDPSPQKD